MTQRRNTLGRGLDALLSMDEIKTDGSSSINEIEISKISVNPNQPRREFNQVALEELAGSIAEIGIIQPITLRELSTNRYQIIAGERRFRASQIAGLTSIPAYIRKASDENVLEMALIENIQREDLNAIEVALAYQNLIEEYSLTQERLSERVGKKRATVANYVRLLKLPAPVQVALQNRQIDMGHARALLPLENPKVQIKLLKDIIANQYSVRKVEELVKAFNEGLSTDELEGSNVMNILARSVLELYTFDPNPDDTSRDNLMRQSIDLLAKIPTIIAYAFNMFRHATFGRSLHIRHPRKKLSFAENFLYMLKRDYTRLDAKMLDLLLIVHAEHGGGNNSTFSVRVTSSTGTDTYSSIAAGIGSLKGPLHGGSNIQVVDMFHHLQKTIKDWTDTQEIDDYFEKMLKKEAYDKSGLIYGIGHAVYTISDPRAVILKDVARDLAREKGKEKEFAFLELLEDRGILTFERVKNNGKTVSSNVDFYSGFIYEMIGLPVEIYTSLFAMARIVGWCAHRNEELNFQGKRIIRPAYRSIFDEVSYVPLDKR